LKQAFPLRLALPSFARHYLVLSLWQHLWGHQKTARSTFHLHQGERPLCPLCSRKCFSVRGSEGKLFLDTPERSSGWISSSWDAGCAGMAPHGPDMVARSNESC